MRLVLTVAFLCGGLPHAAAAAEPTENTFRFRPGVALGGLVGYAHEHWECQAKPPLTCPAGLERKVGLGPQAAPLLEAVVMLASSGGGLGLGACKTQTLGCDEFDSALGLAVALEFGLLQAMNGYRLRYHLGVQRLIMHNSATASAGSSPEGDTPERFWGALRAPEQPLRGTRRRGVVMLGSHVATAAGAPLPTPSAPLRGSVSAHDSHCFSHLLSRNLAHPPPT